MTIQEKKEAVRQFIVRAVPSVMDLKMGCKINIRGDKNATFVRYDKEYIYWLDEDLNACDEDSKYMEDLNFEIIGRPIQLQDVLVAINKSYEISQAIKSEKEIMFIYYELINTRDLSQDFDHQSEAVWEFLHGLLCE